MIEVEQALLARLLGTAALVSALGGTAVYADVAPPKSGYPLVIVAQMAGTDDNDTSRRSRQLIYSVQAVAPPTAGGKRRAEQIDALIDGALHDSPLAVSGWTTIWQRRESDVAYTEYGQDGLPYAHAGGLYRVRLTR